MISWFRGLGYLPRALLFVVRNRPLWRYFPGPFLIGIAVFAGEIWAVRAGIRHYAPGAGWVTLALAWVSGIFAAILLFLALQGLLAAPFCEAAAERCELLACGRLPDRPPIMASVRSIGHTATRTSLYLMLLLPVLAMGLVVPGAGVLGFVITSVYSALDAMDYPTSRRAFTMKRKWQFARSRWGLMLGFGMGQAFLGMLPVLGLVAPLVGAVAGTLLFLDVQDRVE
jgi:uncharacterized protein involved in cysteine biosynthesis